MSRGQVDHEMKERVISLAERGILQAEIVRMTGQHRTTVNRWLWKAQRAGRNVQTRVSRFGVNVMAKLPALSTTEEPEAICSWGR